MFLTWPWGRTQIKQQDKKNKFDQQISELQISEAPTLMPSSSIGDAIELLQKAAMAKAVVLENDNLVGVVNEHDLVCKIFIENDDYHEASVSELMTEAPPMLNSQDTLRSAIALCAEKEVRDIPVQFEHGYKLLSNKDILQAIINIFPGFLEKFEPLINRMTTTQLIQNESDEYFDEDNRHEGAVLFTPISRIIAKDIVKMDVSVNMAQIFQVMRIRSCSVIVLTEYDTSIRGIITERDILARVLGGSVNLTELSVVDYMTPNPHRVTGNHFLAHAVANMFCFGYRNILVVDSDDYPVAVISFIDIMRFLLRAIS